jgi:membrane fusion protein, multidrug efflux system
VIALLRIASLPSSVALALLASACGSGSAPKAAEGGVQKREVPSVRVTPVAMREMSRVLETTSKLESEREIELMPRLSGVVLALEAEEGDVVEQGAVLARLDDVEQGLAVKDAEVALHEAKNTLDELRLALRESDARVNRSQLAYDQAVRDYERNEKLFAGEKVASALSQSALEASRLARDNADADRTDAELARERARLELAAGETAVERATITLERGRVTLSHMRITAPFAGVVAQRGIKVGDAVGPATTAFVLTDVALLRCVFSRPQEELALFARVGSENGDGRLTLSATADAFPGRTFLGWIERVSPTIDAQSGQFRVTGRLECVQDGGRVRLLPGMLVRLSIVTDRHPEALVVPKRALDREGERRYVWTVRKNIARRVEVREGFGQDAWAEVVPAVPAELVVGDPVVVVGARDLAEGDEVRVDVEEGAPVLDAEPAEKLAEEPAEASTESSAESTTAESTAEPR